MTKKSWSIAVLPLLLLFGLGCLLSGIPSAQAYETWSAVNAGDPSCSDCHGGFLTSPYNSPKGTAWTGNLHDTHRTTMLSSDCNVCHVSSGRKPVYMYTSAGGTGFAAIGCSGCHVGAGLRKHHQNAGVTLCYGCHTSTEASAAENVKPPYYFTPDTAHPNKPTDPCGITKSENYAGTSVGLDNDGNLLYDQADPACAVVAPPKADAGPAQTVNEGATVTLSGANSTGTGLTYLWTQTAGTPTVTLATPNAVSTTFTAPAVGAAGTSLTFQLTVTDTAKQTSSATTIVTVKDVNQPPVANAGPTQTAASGVTVTLDGSNSSDPDGTIASYAWTQTAGPAVTLSNPAAAKPTFTAPSVGTAGASLTFQLAVTDNGGLTATATTTVNVTHVNVPPTANAGPNQTVSEGALVTLDGSNSSDSDGTIASYAWTQTAGPAVALSSAAIAKPTFTAPAVGAGGASLTFQLTVTDNGGLKASATTVVNVTNVNQPPIANAGPNQTVAQGASVTLDGSNSSDPDGSVVSYLWTQTGGPSVTLSNPAVAKPTFTAPSNGAAATLTFSLKVTDDGGLTATATTVVNVTAANNTAPTANAGPDQTVAEGATVTLDGSASTDPDGSIASYLWTQTAGPSVTLSNPAAAKPTFTAPAVGASGAALTFQLTVKDNGGLSGTDTVIINVTNVAQPPVANAGSNQTVAAGATVTLDGSRSSATDGTIVSYLWTQTAGTSVTLSDPAAIGPTFTAPSTAGTLTFQLTVTTDLGLSSTASVTVTVTAGGTGTEESVQLTADFPSPEPVGAIVTFVATPSGPAVPYEYRFSFRRDDRRWIVAQPYSPNTSWTWYTKGLRGGEYSVRVEMRAIGSKKAYEARKTVEYRLGTLTTLHHD